MSKKTRLVVGIGALIAVNVCALWFIYWNSGAGRANHVRVMTAFPAAEVDRADRLGVVFDLPVARQESVGKPIALNIADIEPSHPGEWVWATADRLEYRLGKPLHAGMTYRIRLTDGFARETGMMVAGQSEFTFSTRALAVESCELESADDTHLNIRVRFNQPVEPEALDRVATTVDVERSTALTCACLSRSPSDELIVRVERPQSGRVRFQLDKSLVGSGAERGLEAVYSSVLAVDAPFLVERVAAWPSSFQKLQEVRINFNRTLKQDQSAPAVRFEPAVEDVRCDVEWDDVRVKGKFACGRKYKAIIAAGLQDEHGKALDKEQVVSFEVPDRAGAIRFPIRQGVLSPAGNLLLDMEVVNCANIDLVVSRLHENNLVAHLRGTDAEATSREIVEKSIAVKSPQNEPTTVSVDLRELLGKPGGIYHIQARSHEDRWTESESVVAVTDIGLSCKKEREGLFVWATSVRTAQPLAGVSVNVLTYNNQTLATEMSGADGCARIRLPNKSPDGAPYVVVAQREGDVSYCMLDSRTWVPDGIDLAGRSPTAPHDVMLYPERGVYRPGDVIHLTGVIRKNDGSTPSAFPIWIRTRRPDGKEAGAETVMPRPENQGMFHVEVHTREDDQMGPYRFTATLPGSDEVLGETSALVEAFLPIRIEMSAESAKARYVGEGIPSVSVDGTYLFGKPAAGVDVAVSGTYRAKKFVSKKFAEFEFGPIEVEGEAKIKEAKDALDATGHRVVKLNAPPGEKPGVWQGRAVVTLTETGSRSVSKTVEFEHQTGPRQLGLMSATGEVVAANSEVELKWVQVDGESEPVEGRPFELSVEKIDHDWVIRDVDGQMTWKTVERRTAAMKKRMVNVDAPQAMGSTMFAVEEPGEYIVTAVESDGGAKTELKFRVFDADEGGSWAVSEHPERIELAMSEKAYEPGTMGECLVQAPFAGQLLLTVEDDRVRESKVVEIASSPAKVEFFVPTSLRGDAFVTATLVRPVDPERKKWLPNSARGIVRLPLQMKTRALPVELVGPRDIGSRECAKFWVRAGLSDFDRPPVVHVWAVDDGILLSTGYQSPDPLKHYFGPRALDVESTDMFASLMPDVARPASMLKIGADGEDDGMDLRRNPVPSKRREPAVVWLASRATDAEGYAEFDVQMPEMSGRMRVMAVAVEGDRYGKASSDVTVTSPLMVEAGWPRFLAPGDRCRVPLKLFNNSGEELRVTLSALTKGGTEVALPADGEVMVDATTPSLVWLDVNAGEMGPTEVEIWAWAESSDGVVFANANGAFPVRPATAMDTVTTIQRLIAGDKLVLPPAEGFLANSTETEIEIDARTGVELRPAVEQLLDYPYGCVEQTSSRLWALLEAGKLVKDRVEEDSRYGRIDDMISAGIARLWSMQTRSGGLSYWPGSPTADRWGTTYACAILAEASIAGFKIDPGFRRDLAQYLEKAIGDSELHDDNVRAMMCESLAAFDKPNASWMARLSERTERLDLGGRAALARAWFMAGERERARNTLPRELPPVVVRRTTGGRITSEISQIASLVRTLKLVDPDSPWIVPLIEKIRAAGEGGQWASTLENATAIAALVNAIDEPKVETNYSGEILWDGDTLAFDQAKPIRFSDRRVNKSIEIQTKGTGEMLVLCRQKGLRDAASLSDFDRGLSVRRKWTRANGQPAKGHAFKVGELVTVDVTLEAVDLGEGEFVDNVAIVDALPAGFEIENPRLASSATSDEPMPQPDRVQFLDDRVLLFARAEGEPRTYRYHLRTVTAGSFVLPPVEASCMYDGTLASLQTGGRIEIEP